MHFISRYFNYHDESEAIAEDIVGQITQLEAEGTDASGQWGRIKDMANMNYRDSTNTLYSLRIRKITPIRNIGIENLKLMRTPNTKATTYVHNIRFDFAINCWVHGVESYKPSRSHLSVTRSSHLEISGCYFHEAMDYCGGGWGYGVCLENSTTNCLVENTIFRHLRHSLVAASGSNCNVWTFNYSREQLFTYEGDPTDDPTNRDLDLHAKYPFGHLFEHNIVERMASDDAHGDNGPYNAFLRNMATENIIDFKTMKLWSSLGNMEDVNDILYPLRHDWDYAPVLDIYGLLNNYLSPVAHNIAYDFGAYSSYRLDDVSYYYSTIPEFLIGYSWPAIGPKTTESGELSFCLPALDRFNLTKKTYCPHPTPHSYYLAGVYAQNLDLKDNVFITSDVTIASGYTLTLQPGSIVSISSSARITVNGTLKAEGTAAQKIIFTRTGASGSWYGVRFEDSSIDADCKLKYCDITYSSYGVYCSHASPEIENNTFSNNTYAFYLYYSSPSIKTNLISNDRIFADHSNPYFFDNHINNPYENYAMYLFQSSPSLLRNTFEGTMIDYMIKAHSYSNPGFGHISDSVQAYNRIEASGGDWAFLAEDHSLPFLGSTNTCVYRGKLNTIMGADVICLAAAHTYSRIEAGYVWWGQYPAPTGQFYADGTSYLGYSFALNSDPGGGSSLGKSISQLEEDSDNDSVFNPPAPVGCDSLWQTAEKAVADCKIPAALAVYETLMSRYSQTAQAHFALARTIALQKETSAGALGATLARLLATPKLDRPFLAAVKDAIMNNFLRLGDPKAATIAAEEIVAEYPGSMQEYSALYTLYSIYSKEMHDEGQARQILETLKEKYPNRELTLIAQYDMGEKVEWKLAKEPASKESVALTTPAAFSLGTNYPNPFNSTTVIPFYVPSESIVALTIYDILGREIAVLVDGRVASGQ